MTKSISKGDDWPDHYRGTRYHFREHKVWWQTHKDGIEVQVIKGHESILKDLLTLKIDKYGSFRITESGDVITKVKQKDGTWKPVFVCEMDTPFKFSEKIDLRPSDLKPGDLWPGFYDGARYSKLMDKVWWNNPDGPRQYIVEELPWEIVRELRLHKPMGGSFRINEHGYVITLIQAQPLRNELKGQFENFSITQQQLMRRKVKTTYMLPVYIGKYHEGISLKPPVDYTLPLTDDERNEMLTFLDSFSLGKKKVVAVDASKADPEDIEFLDDPEDWE